MTDGRHALGRAPHPVSVDDASTGIDALTARFTPGRPAVVCYVPLGDPLLAPAAMLDAYADSGVDVLEVGVPTRDPWLDGAEVAESMARACDAGIDAPWVGETLGAWRRERMARGSAVPAIVWFGYPDVPLGAIQDAAAARAIDALLLIDPHQHAVGRHALDAALATLGVARCAFVPWEASPPDLDAAAGATGYVMVQARPGVTGADGMPGDPRPLVRTVRRVAPGRPVVAGFGVGQPWDVRRVLGAGVDGVVVGSACVRALRDGGDEGLRAFLRSIVDAPASTTSTGP